jgi:hypothetical protein
MPMTQPLGGCVEPPARVSSICLVVVARNSYSVPCELAEQMVSVGVGCLPKFRTNELRPMSHTSRNTSLQGDAVTRRS